MNFEQELNAFHDWLETNPLDASAQTLWVHLMALAKKSGWPEWFLVINPLLMAKVGVTENTLSKHRNILQQRGRIEYRSQGKQKAGKYRIIPFTAHSTSNIEVDHEVKREVNREVKHAVNIEVKGAALINDLDLKDLDLKALRPEEKERIKDRLTTLFNEMKIQGGVMGLHDILSYIGVVAPDLIERALKVGEGKSVNYAKRTLNTWIAQGFTKASDVFQIPEPGSAPSSGSRRTGDRGWSAGRSGPSKPKLDVVKTEAPPKQLSDDERKKLRELAQNLDRS
ncbi:hypothetical protein SAMN05216312_12247 [Cohnella sp. OV330]|uniref:hypothetical protein n=1 Tax=Cohnella sp. OV330 TaxID=1855288 RepID=UPI0008E3D284|nr:hypothetical protein [Cohnella sp. OV330]SFB62716.1 hypothetical protein SAMN05216312_12247 [Cohnella sp. OV330]